MLIKQLLTEKGHLLLDGATGTNLFELGLPAGTPPDLWNLNNPKLIIDLHADFIKAGSDIVLTNSFGATSFQLAHNGLSDRVKEINLQAAKLLRYAIDQSGRKVVAAGSIGMTGDLEHPRSQEERIADYFNQMATLKSGGIDLVWIETMSDLGQTQAAIDAASRVELPYVVTMAFDRGLKTMMGVSAADFVQFIHGQQHKPFAFGVNCGGPTSDALFVLDQIKKLSAESDVLVSKANCGIPEYKNGRTQYSGTLDVMSAYAGLAKQIGAQIIGGCCGTTPAHIRTMGDALARTTQESSFVTDVDIIASTGSFSDVLNNQRNATQRRPRR